VVEKIILAGSKLRKSFSLSEVRQRVESIKDKRLSILFLDGTCFTNVDFEYEESRLRFLGKKSEMVLNFLASYQYSYFYIYDESLEFIFKSQTKTIMLYRNEVSVPTPGSCMLLERRGLYRRTVLSGAVTLEVEGEEYRASIVDAHDFGAQLKVKTFIKRAGNLKVGDSCHLLFLTTEKKFSGAIRYLSFSSHGVLVGISFSSVFDASLKYLPRHLEGI
jgi:hypothetical protein